MSLFDSILPQAPTDVQTPTNLMAQLRGLPITSGQASALSQLTPNVTTTPGAPSMPAPTDPLAGLRSLRMPASTRPAAPPIDTSALPDPTRTGLDAAAQAAGNTPAESNPLNTLLISLAHGVTAGVPAFRAQKRANVEATQAAALQAHDYQQHRDFINSPAAAKMFGDQIGAARALSDAELGPWLAKNNVVEPVEYSQNLNGDTVQVKGPGATGQPVYRGPARAVNPGQAVPRFTMVNGVATPVRDANGQPVYDTPNPLPQPRPAALTAAQQRENTIRNIAGIGPNDPITDDNRAAYQKAVAWVDAQARTPRAAPQPRSGRLVMTDQGIVSVDPITHVVTPLTDANGAPLQKEKSAAMMKAKTDSALVAKITGTGAAAAAPTPANADRRTANAKAILNGTRPGDKKLAQDWLTQHPE